ncbi:MAG: DNA topoisomerase I [Spirochaetes bacterium GWB1_48_6]|nr:MAG: DNA topoisomerase I [Spirochaetes bacterium GWB1_48_6]
MEKKILVIVESPTKAKTIKKFLPSHYRVEASVGHIRDLPQTAAEIPAKYKKEPWATMGIDVDQDFKPLYVIPRDKSALVKELKAAVKEVDMVYLATDEDREGESISWHLLDVLQPTCPVKRMVFHEITQKAITEALDKTRDIDLNLVNAQETRRLLDRLYGYTLSPLIWKKIAYGLSAGRVQSSGLRLIVDREMARCRFQPAEYWDLAALLEKTSGGEKSRFEAKLTEISGRKIALGGKDFDPETGEIYEGRKVVLLGAKEAQALRASLEKGNWTVEDLNTKESTQKPSPPFITSTLQQEANRKLGLGTRDTMRVAQSLYEEGFITYMRTDSPHLSEEALEGARSQIIKLYGPEYTAPEPRQFGAKSKNAQESHEAIRPVGAQFMTPEQTGLTGRERSLYELIWKRTLASQMAEAKKNTVTVKIRASEALFTASGVQILFPGFLRVYVEGRDDPEAVLDNMETFLPPLTPGEVLKLHELKASEHHTKPPSRYTEASLVQRLEKEGIGRPSTYATIIATLLERGYVIKKDSALAPTFTGVAVVGLLEKNFGALVEYEFTSKMEKDLDEIALGQEDRIGYLKEFYLGDKGLRNQVETKESKINPDESRTVILPQIGTEIPIKVGRFGPYVSLKKDGESVNASLPDDWAPSDVKKEDFDLLVRQQLEGPAPLGTDPVTGKSVFLLLGKNGPYFQLGTKDDPDKKTSSAPKTGATNLSLEEALKLLALPRKLGLHPELQKEILANNGRFGPYVVCDGVFRSLKKTDELYGITLERALELLSEEKIAKASSKALKDFGTYEGKKLQVLSGRYGPYIKYGTVNISLPEDKKTPETAAEITLDEIKVLLGSSTKKTKVSRKKVTKK